MSSSSSSSTTAWSQMERFGHQFLGYTIHGYTGDIWGHSGWKVAHLLERSLYLQIAELKQPKDPIWRTTTSQKSTPRTVPLITFHCIPNTSHGITMCYWIPTNPPFFWFLLSSWCVSGLLLLLLGLTSTTCGRGSCHRVGRGVGVRILQELLHFLHLCSCRSTGT